MSERNFRRLLEAQWEKGHFVCVGLDSDYEKIPQVIKAKYPSVREAIYAFNRAIIDATHDLVAAYKPNIAFYESKSFDGLMALRDTILYIHKVAPNLPIILDAKRADIGKTNEGYATSAFDYYQADAITVNPYFGRGALEPFLKRADKGIIVLCRTSNPGAGELQDLPLQLNDELWEKVEKQQGGEMLFIHLYQYVAFRVATEWNSNGNCALVVGATAPAELKRVRQMVGDVPILIPGIGAQGGDLEATVKAGRDSRGRGMIINSSSGIIFASSDDDFAEAAGRETEKLHRLINEYRAQE